MCESRKALRTADRSGAAPRDAVVVVAGPTASGKSALALAVAEAWDGVVINADSMQVYRDLRILTARPDDADLARAPHRLYGVLDGADICSAGRWQALAGREIREAIGRGRLPVVVGGTGLYLRALTEGLSEIPPVTQAATAAAMRRVEREGPQAVHADLARRDPETAARLRPTDRQRLVRALSVLEATGRPLAAWQDTVVEPPAGLAFHTVLLMPPRAALYAACDARFGAMVDAGAMDEVRALLARNLPADCPVMKAIGVRELGAVIAGRCTLDDAIVAAQRATRNYAKRQCTWFRNQMIAEDEVRAKESETALREIFSKIRHFILTHRS